MQREGRPDVDAIWVKPHLNRKGNMVNVVTGAPDPGR